METSHILSAYDKLSAAGLHHQQRVLGDALLGAVEKTPEVRPLVNTLCQAFEGLGLISSAEIIFRLALLMADEELINTLSNYHAETDDAAADL